MNDQTRLKLIALLNALEEGVLSPQQQDELVAMLKSSDEAQMMYLQFQSLSAGLGDYAREGVISADDQPIPLAELARLEAEAEVVSIEVQPDNEPPVVEEDAGSISTRDLLAAGSYLLRHTFTPKVITALATAAVLLLGVTLLIMLSGEGTVQPEFAVTPGGSTQTAVATLTAEHDAVWDSRPSRDLFAGQRLTLLKGFAEVQTRRGATAILEAPTTVEFTDQGNALRLVYGKLVGECPTPGSRGFVVHTPDAKIVDIGTVFGVKHDGETTAHVIEGEIDVAVAGPVAGSPGEPVRLTAGQAVQVDVLAQRVVAVDPPADRFVTDWHDISGEPHVYGQIRYRSNAPADLTASVHELIQLFPEQQAVQLQQDVEIILSKPGHYDSHRDIAPSVIPSGSTVDSYLIHFDPPGGENQPHIQRTATIRFSTPILGCIGNRVSLSKSGQFFANPGVKNRHRREDQTPLKATGIDLKNPDTEAADRVTISDDRRTLTITLYADGTGVDQVRVLVESAGLQKEGTR